MSVVVDGSNGLTFNDATTQVTAASGFGFKNRIINGAMMIDQRNGGAANVLSTNATVNYTLDRWNLNLSSAGANGKMTYTQSTDVPANDSFTKSLHIQTTTAWTGSGNYDALTHNIEGYNIADLRWGTSYAATVTLSFWIKSNVTGTQYVSLSNTNDATYVASYTVNSADTWEKKIITVPGATIGTWGSTNSTGIWIGWDFGSNTNNNGTANAWNAGFYRISGATGNNGFKSLGAYMKLTGVQFEKGSTATSFDWRPYGTELALCQRYCCAFDNRPIGTTYYKFGTATWTSTTSAMCNVVFPVTMRVPPTKFYTSAVTNVFWVEPGTVNFNTCALDQIGEKAGTFLLSGGSGGQAAGYGGRVLSNGANGAGLGAYVIFDSEI